MEPKKVLFVCIHNSARSQMAEAFLNLLGEGRYAAESAGLEPGKLNPVVVEAMRQAGIDISGNKTKSVFEMYKQGRVFDYVITVCDPEAGERCPLFPGKVTRLHWGFTDPSSFTGSVEEKLAKTAAVRDEIRNKIEEFVRTGG